MAAPSSQPYINPYYGMTSQLASLSGPMIVDPGLVNVETPTLPNGAVAPSWNNPLAYTSWDQAGGLGNYLGANAPLFMAGAQTLSGLAGAYTGLKGLSLAQRAFKQQKKEFNINLANQTQSYNTQVSDRIAGRQYNTEAERQAALAAALLTDRSKYAKGG